MQEVFVEQGPDRAKVDDVAGERVVDRLAGEDVDLGMIAAPHHLELARLRDLAGEPHAPRAHDAAILVELDQRPDVLPRVDRHAPRRSGAPTGRSGSCNPASRTRRPGRRPGSRADD